MLSSCNTSQLSQTNRAMLCVTPTVLRTKVGALYDINATVDVAYVSKKQKNPLSSESATRFKREEGRGLQVTSIGLPKISSVISRVLQLVTDEEIDRPPQHILRYALHCVYMRRALKTRPSPLLVSVEMIADVDCRPGISWS